MTSLWNTSLSKSNGVYSVILVTKNDFNYPLCRFILKHVRLVHARSSEFAWNKVFNEINIYPSPTITFKYNRRDLSAINPKLFKEFKASKSGGNILNNNNLQRNEDENSVMSFFDDPNRILDLTKSLSHFPTQSGSFNDLTGRYSLRSQQQDRQSNRRNMPFSSMDSVKSFVNSNKLVCTFVAFFTESFEKTLGEQSRKVHIKFHLEDNTIDVVEPRVENNGG